MLQTTGKPFVIRFDRVVAAYRAVKANKGSHGVDDVSLEAYEEDLQGNLYKLWNRMSSGSYFPQPVREVEIPKKGGGKRPLGIPAVSDRVAQAVVKRELEMVLEPVFHEDSFGYRPHRSMQEALRQAQGRCWKFDWVIDLDIQSFFEDIPHDLLMKAVKKHTACRWHLLYIERWLKAPVQQVDGAVRAKEKGTPQGGVIGPCTHPQTLYLRGDFRSNGEDFDKFIKGSIFMINGKSTEFGAGQADQSGVCSAVKGEACFRDSRVFNREIRSFSNTSISLCTASQREQREGGYSGGFRGVYRQTASEPDQTGEKVCTFSRDVDQQVGPGSAGRVSVKAGSWQKRRDKLKRRIATTGYGSKSSLRFTICLSRQRIVGLSAPESQLLN
jgi:RNA-directed DNA polymerase